MSHASKVEFLLPDCRASEVDRARASEEVAELCHIPRLFPTNTTYDRSKSPTLNYDIILSN